LYQPPTRYGWIHIFSIFPEGNHSQKTNQLTVGYRSFMNWRAENIRKLVLNQPFFFMEQISFVSPASEASQYVCLVMVEDGGDPNHKIGIHGYNHHN